MGYTGTISQNANAITVSGSVSFAAGTFSGGSANITVSGIFTNSGTTFTSTSGVLEFRSNAAFTGGSFSHNNGTVRFNGSGTVSGISPSLYILEFVGTGGTYTLSSVGTISVAGSLNLTGTLFYNLASGTIDVKGDINSSNTGTGSGGNTLVTITGTGTQNFSGSTTPGGGALPQLTINKTSGMLNLSNYPAVSNNFTYTAGTISAGTSTFCFTHGNVGSYTISGNLSFANIEFFINTSLLTVTLSSTLTATGNLTLAGAGNFIVNTGTINLNGNLVLTNTGNGGGGTGTINIVGAGAQTIDGSAITVNQSRLPMFTINKASGTLSLVGNISFASNVTYTAGTINAGTSVCYIVNNLTLTGGLTVNNLTISAAGNETVIIASGSTVTTNTLDLEGGSNYITLNTGTIAVQGNIIDNNSSTIGGGTATVLINGSGPQSISSTGVQDQGKLPAVTINKPSGTLTLPSMLTTVGSWTYVSGIVDAATNNSTVVFANILTIAGTHTLNHALFEGSNNYTFTIAAGTTLTLNGNMAITGSGNVTLSTGTINLNGDLDLTNTGVAGGGTATIAFTGATNQAITGALTIYQSCLPAVTINKASGTLTFPALITVRGNWTYQAGSCDVTTNASTIVFGNSLNISGNPTLNNAVFDGSGNYTYSLAGTTLTLSGNMTLSGTGNLIFNNGNINLNGNLLLNNTATAGTGTTNIAFIGASNQAILSSLGINQCSLPVVTINKPSGILTLPTLITVRGNWTYISGGLDVSTNNSTVVFANTLTLTGSHSLNHVNLEGNFNNTYTVSAGTILTVTGTLTTSGSSNVTLTTPVNGATAIQAQGDIVINNSSTNGGGLGAILINGAGAQTLTGNVPAGQGRLPYVTIQKPSGTLTLSGIISVTRDWSFLSGTVNPSTSTVVFGGNNLAVSSVGMSFNHVSLTSNTATLSNSLFLNGDLSISGTGVLAPGAKTINLGGNWTNWGTGGFTEGSSTVNFNGSSIQTLTTTGGENFNSVVINNTGGGIQLGNDVTTGSALTMNQGNIDLNGNNMTLGTSAAVPGTLVRSLGAIIGTGAFKRWFNTSLVPDLSSTGLFPMGTATNYSPLYVTAPVTAPTTGGTIAVAYTNANTNSAVSIPDGASTVLIRKDLNWAVTSGNGLLGGSYNLDAQGTNFGTIGSVSDLRLTLSNAVVGSAGINAGTLLAPQVNRTGLTLANLSNSFYIGSVNVSTPLPLTLFFFTATAANGKVRLDWKTANEKNNDYFTIQRSGNVVDWTDIQTIDGRTSSNADTLYTVYDQQPLSGLSYYRLRQTDIDGKYTFSAIKTVNINGPSIVNIYPNPASSYLVVGTLEGNASVRLLNCNGQHVIVPTTRQGDSMTFYLSSLPKGAYFVQIVTGNACQVSTFIKE